MSEEAYGKIRIKKTNFDIQGDRHDSDLVLNYSPIEKLSLIFRIYKVSTAASKAELFSQTGCVTQLRDASNRGHVTDSANSDCERFVRTIMAGETYTFIEALHTWSLIKSRFLNDEGDYIYFQVH